MSDNIAHAISGAGGGIISMFVTYPLIISNSRIQAKHGTTSNSSCRNTLDAFIKILRKEGLKGLYSGFTSGAFGITITNGVYYYYYEYLKSVLTKGDKSSLTTKQSMISSLAAGTAVVLATHPIWTIKTKISLQKRSSPDKKGPSTLQMLLYTLRREGLSGLYAGSKTAMILILNPIIQYAIFENLKSRLRLYKGSLKGLDYFILGAFSKLCASMIMYPYIYMKSRLKSDKNMEEITTSGYIKTVIRDEGIRGLYKGLDLKLVQSVLGSAVLFCAKEMLFDWSIWALIALGFRKQFH